MTGQFKDEGGATRRTFLRLFAASALFRWPSQAKAATTASILYVPIFNTDILDPDDRSSLAYCGRKVADKHRKERSFKFVESNEFVPRVDDGAQRLVILHGHGDRRSMWADQATIISQLFGSPPHGDLGPQNIARILTRCRATHAVLLSCMSSDIAKEVSKIDGMANVIIAGVPEPFESDANGNLIDTGDTSPTKGGEVRLRVTGRSNFGRMTLEEFIQRFEVTA